MPTSTPDRRARPAIVFRHDPFSRRALTRMAAGAVVVVALGWVLGAIVSAASPLPVEEGVIEAVTEVQAPWATTLLEAVSRAGSLEVVAVLVVAAVPLLRALTRGWEAPWLLGLALVGSLLTTAAIKVLVGRERPVEALVETSSAAFPSGHASRAAAVLGLAIWAVVALSRRPMVRRLIVGVLVLGVMMMGWSRAYLGAHWVSDILFGLGLGVWWLFVLLRAVQPVVVPAVAVGPDEPQVRHP